MVRWEGGKRFVFRDQELDGLSRRMDKGRDLGRKTGMRDGNQNLPGTHKKRRQVRKGEYRALRKRGLYQPFASLQR